MSAKVATAITTLALLALPAGAGAHGGAWLSMARARVAIARLPASDERPTHYAITHCWRETPTTITCSLFESYLPSGANDEIVALTEYPTVLLRHDRIFVVGSMREWR
jgi:hypothetical protein